MTCDEFVRVVDAYLDDELSISDILHVQGHLISCEQCHQVLRAEITLHALIMDDATRDRPPESLRERILRRVIAEETLGGSSAFPDGAPERDDIDRSIAGNNSATVRISESDGGLAGEHG